MSPLTQRSVDEPIDILLVEDNPGDVRLTREAFAGTEYEIEYQIFADGDAAIEYLLRQASADERPDLALLDLNLPGRDGCEVLETIRANSALQNLPVIILTSSAAEEDVARCYASNANAYLTKPDDPADFRSIAREIEQFWFERAHLPPAPT